MIGSDWPVLTLAGTMERWFSAVLEVVDRLPADDKDDVLRGTAAGVYGIER